MTGTNPVSVCVWIWLLVIVQAKKKRENETKRKTEATRMGPVNDDKANAEAEAAPRIFDRVEVLCEGPNGKDEWYLGTITAEVRSQVLGTRMFQVLFDDGEVAPIPFPNHEMRILSPTAAAAAAAVAAAAAAAAAVAARQAAMNPFSRDTVMQQHPTAAFTHPPPPPPPGPPPRMPRADAARREARASRGPDIDGSFARARQPAPAPEPEPVARRGGPLLFKPSHDIAKLESMLYDPTHTPSDIAKLEERINELQALQALKAAIVKVDRRGYAGLAQEVLKKIQDKSVWEQIDALYNIIL